MRKGPRENQKPLAFRVTQEVRTLVEQLAAKLTVKRGERHTLTDVVIEGIYLLAKKEKLA